MLVIGVAVAALAAALLLYLVVERVGRAGLPLAALRAAAWGAWRRSWSTRAAAAA